MNKLYCYLITILDVNFLAYRLLQRWVCWRRNQPNSLLRIWHDRRCSLRPGPTESFSCNWHRPKLFFLEPFFSHTTICQWQRPRILNKKRGKHTVRNTQKKSGVDRRATYLYPSKAASSLFLSSNARGDWTDERDRVPLPACSLSLGVFTRAQRQWECYSWSTHTRARPERIRSFRGNRPLLQLVGVKVCLCLHTLLARLARLARSTLSYVRACSEGKKEKREWKGNERKNGWCERRSNSVSREKRLQKKKNIVG